MPQPFSQESCNQGRGDHLNDGCHDSNVKTQGRVPMAIPQEEPPVIGVEATQPHTITIPTREAGTRLLSRRLLIRIHVVPPPGGKL
ncbi:hypothetical protein AVEN_115104-1 [Araneus ventricosus]|uniref:Uncharacterized protein n=1 Tax=Araneus ventricosus TaxID=182803 RepID=A0A4Y1ZZ25_ARAVE|nr:hypothetical protein AVEN_115104-1 [Araneus ventricosus]